MGCLDLLESKQQPGESVLLDSSFKLFPHALFLIVFSEGLCFVRVKVAMFVVKKMTPTAIIKVTGDSFHQGAPLPSSRGQCSYKMAKSSGRGGGGVVGSFGNKWYTTPTANFLLHLFIYYNIPSLFRLSGGDG